MSRARLKVAFDAAGGHRAGVGHVLRSLALAEHVRRLGARASLIAPVSAGALSVAAIPVSTDQPDVLVVDRPDTTSELLRRHHERWPAARMVALDYYGSTVDGLVSVINLNEARERGNAARPQRYYRGLRYATLRPTFARQRRARRGVRARVRHILIGFGGTDPSGWTVAALDTLRTMLPPAVQVDVLSGRSLPAGARGRPGVITHVSVADPAGLLQRSDLAVIGGGTMMIEAACLGLPAVVIPRTPEERLFAGQFARAGAVRLLRSSRRFPVSAVQREVGSLLEDTSARLQMHRAGRRLVDGRGTDRVARMILRAGRIGA